MFLDEAGDAFDAVDVVVQDVGLSAPAVFAFAGVGDGVDVPFAEDGLDVLSSSGRGGDDADVAQAAEGEVEGARDGGGGEGEQVGVASEAFEFFFVADAEALFFVDDDKAEVVEGDVFLQEAVGADDEVGLARFEALDGFFGFSGAFEAADVVDGDGVVGEAVLQVVVVLT